MVKKCTDDIPKIIIDQNAQTVEDMMEEVPRGQAWMYRYANKMASQGKWERVWKRVKTRLVPAYRPIRRKK